MSSIFTGLAGLAVVVPLLLGCGSSQPELVPVRGRIMMLDKPVSEIMVSFAPIGSTPGSGAVAATDSDGQFELMDVRGGKGAHAGQYKVHLYPAPAINPEGPPTHVVSKGGGSVPPIYIDPNRTPLVADVPESGGFVEISLTRDGKNAKTATTPHPN